MASNQSALSRFVDKLMWRSALNREEQDAILGLTSHASQIRAHFDIVSPGELVDHACLIAHGVAARVDEMSDGRRQITSFYFRGDMCDLHSVAVPKAAWAILAITTVTVVRVPHSELRALVSKYPAIALAFWRDATADASVLAKWVGNLGRRNARSRVAHLLCEIGMLMERAGLGTRTCFEFGATQEQLADAVGLTAVHLNRTLQALRREGLLQTEGRTFHVGDWDRLSQVAEFDPGYLLLDRQIDDEDLRVRATH